MNLKLLFFLFWVSTIVGSFKAPDINKTIDADFESYSVERKLSVFFLIAIPPIGLVLYVPLIYIILARKRKYTNTFYKLVLAVGINDYFLLFHLMYSGVCIAKNYCPGGERINVALMTVAVFSCYTCMLMNLTIAFNRFVAVYFFKYYESHIFSPSMTIVYIGMVVVGAATANIPSWTFGMKFYPDLMTHWFYQQPSEAYIAIWHIYDLFLGYGLHAALILLYLLSFVKVYKMSKNSDNRSHQSKNHRLLIQACVNAIPCLLYINMYHFGQALFQFVFALMCMVMTPFIYLWFNKDLRYDFLDMIKSKKKISPTSTSSMYTDTANTDKSSRRITNSAHGTSSNMVSENGIHPKLNSSIHPLEANFD